MNIKKIKTLFLLKFFIFYIFFLFLDFSISSDYIAYFNRFAKAEYYLKNDEKYFFDLVHYLMFELPIKYKTHLKIYFTINYLLFFFLIWQLIKKNINLIENNYKLVMSFLILFIFIFSFEYLVIRLRAGSCILLMFGSYIFFSKNNFKISLMFLICAMFTHIETFLIFFYATFFLFFLIKSKKINIYLELLILIIASLALILISYYLNINLIRSSELTLKPLNYYRMTIYCLFPLIWIFYINLRNKNFLLIKSNNMSEVFLKMLFFFLIIIAAISATNIRLYVGEDVLRIFGILSFVMIFLLFESKYFRQTIILNFYIIITNYLLFFKNYLYLFK